MYATTVKLLRAVSERVGGDKALAQRLGIDDALLASLMSGQQEMPERVLLGTVDIILESEESQRVIRSRSDVQPAPNPTVDR
jgi:DNA-binding transcriptional regulator YdaS (Cro superfamily)